ncbi:SDR family oxidoreductase [Spiribacter sp. 1M153]|uniref:SDR family oxidoreductase n=1 Tax=Spiribacter roseus TaxID=1855875 RepID=UPI00349FA822
MDTARSQQPARVLIAGCGRIGTRLGQGLADQGHTVFGLRRRPEGLPAPIIPCAADLNAPAGLADRLPGGLDRVVVILTPPSYDDAGYRRGYVEALSHLCAALAASGNAGARLVFVSSTGVYGENGGAWVDESTPPVPSRFSGQRLLEAETVAARHPGGSVVVRFAGIYGPGRESLLRRVASGAGCQAEPPRYTNRIHEDDCVAILDWLSDHPNPAPLYLGVDDRPCPQCEIMDWLAAELGQPTPARTAGEAMGRRCSNRRLKAAGYRLRHPDYRSGYPSLLAERRSNV